MKMIKYFSHIVFPILTASFKKI